MKSNSFLLLSWASIFVVCSTHAATIQKANNTNNLNLTTSWSGGVVPGANDIASWNNTVGSSNSTAPGADLTWKGISITDPGGPVTIGAGNILTLGSSGIDMSAANQDLTISSGITLSSGQTWDVITGQILTLNTGVVVRSPGATLVANGGGSITTTNIANVNGIVGPWAAVNNSGTNSYATVSAGVIQAYTAPNVVTNTPVGGWGNIPSTGLGIDPTANWDITTAATYPNAGANRSVNTIRYTGFGAARQNSNSTSAAGVFVMTLNGFMNAGSGPFTIGGDPGAAAPTAANGRLNLTIGASRELVLAPMLSDIIVNGVIANSGANASGVTVFGNQRVILNGNSTYTGPTVVSGGTLQVASPVATFGSINTSSGILINGSNAKYLHTSTVASNRAITLTRGVLDGTGVIGAVTVGAGSGGVVTHGNGTTGLLTLGSLTFSGAGTASLKLAGGATTATPALAVTGALTTPGSPGAVTVDFQAPTASLVNGSTYALIGYGSFAGNTSDFAAAGPGLNPRQSVSFGNDTVNKLITATVTGDTPKWTGGDSNEWLAGNTGPNKNWKLIGTSAATDFIQGDAVLFDDSATGPTTVEIANGDVSTTGTTFNNSNKNYTIGSVSGFRITGNGALVKSGSGSVTFTTVNTLTGATTINAGTLQLGDGSTDGSISASSGITNNGSLVYRVTGNQTYVNAIIGSGSVTKNDDGVLTLSGANTYSGNTNIIGGTVVLNGAGTLGTGSVSLAAGSSLNIDKNLNLTGIVTGSGAINNTGSATVTGDFSGFSGTYTHNSAGVSTGFATPSSTSKNASYVIASVQGSFQGMIANGNGDYTLELGSLTGVANSLFRGGNTATGTTTLQIGNLNGMDTFSGGIANGATKIMAVNKVGTGTLTFAGNNAYSGNTTVSGGTLALADDAQLRFVIGANGVNNSISGSGILKLDGDFNLDLTGANQTVGNSWTLVNTSTLVETYASTFSLVGFTENGNVHTLAAGANVWTFTESTGVLTYTVGSSYASWAAANVGGALADVDTDGDGVKNGVEFFMNSPAGFTANPGPNALNIVTWINGGNIPAADYGTRFLVQTTPDLVNWSNVLAASLTTNTDSSLQYTLPTGQGKVFVRLVVLP